MNEEEIMDIIKGKLLMIKRMLEEDDNDGHASAYEIQSEDFEAIQGLLDLYNKEKEKNKKLKDKCKELIFEKQELTSALLDSTPNDKIKAKIEECELLIDNSQGCMSDEDLYKEYGKIEFGQSLLEEKE